MTTHADPEGTGDGVRQSAGGLPRLITIGRLDFNTEGLLLLTNDGGLRARSIARYRLAAALSRPCPWRGNAGPAR
jgi:16S rRNA U516 pseudouridylate synthase RsuA-like enzyme